MLRLAAVQHDIEWEDAGSTLHRVEPLVARAAASGARLIALPEMFATGFSLDADRTTAQSAAIAAACVRWARDHRVWLIAGWVEPGSGARRMSVEYSIRRASSD